MLDVKKPLIKLCHRINIFVGMEASRLEEKVEASNFTILATLSLLELQITSNKFT